MCNTIKTLVWMNLWMTFILLINTFANCPWITLDWEVIIFLWSVVSWQETSWNIISCLYLISPGLKKCKKWHILPHSPLVWVSISVSVCVLTDSLLSFMTQSSLVHCPKRFFRNRNAQIRASFTRSMEASSDGHWWRIFCPFPSSSSSSYDSYELLMASES